MKLLMMITGLLSSLILFMPKSNLYFMLQDFLKKQNIYINSNIRESSYLELSNATVYVNKLDVITFDKCLIYPFIIYNRLECKNINFLDNYKTDISVKYSLLDPLNIKIKGRSNFGNIDGEINLIKKEGKIYITNITNGNIKKFLKKDKKGYFYYAKF